MLINLKKDLGISTVASFVSFSISFLLTPIMARFYEPSDYGLFAVVNNISTFIATILLMSLPNVIPLVKKGYRRSQLIIVVIHFALIAFIISSIGVAIFYYVVQGKSVLNKFESAYLMIPFLVISIALQRIAFSIANADAKFESMSIARVMHPLISKPSAIIASFLTTHNPLYIILFEGIGYLLQVVIMAGSQFLKLKLYRNLFTCKQLLIDAAMLKRYQDYAIYLNFVNILAMGLITLETLIITGSYGVSTTGMFTFANSMVSLPIQLVSMATAPIIYHHLINVAVEGRNKLFRKVLKIFTGFILLGIVPYTIFFLYGAELFKFAFGETWTRSGVVGSILALPMYLQFISMPITSIFRVTSTIKLQFVIELIFMLIILCVFYWATHVMQFMDALFILAIIICVQQLTLIGFSFIVSFSYKKL